MSQNILVKIDLKKMDKEQLFKGKDGATYLDLVLFHNRSPDKYGNDFMVVQGISKEAREAGEKGYILGNGKFIGGQKPTPKKSHPADDDLF